MSRTEKRVALDAYRKKRDFGVTPEPRGRARQASGGALHFVVQQHAARRLHYDFRLELDGVLKSWAVPKGPSMVPGERRLAAQTEDHPLEYADFEGVIPAGEYGGGTVQVWDRGTWEPIGDARAGLDDGDLSFRLDGTKLRGRFHLTRMRPRPSDRGKASWLLIKGRDAEARKPGTPDVVETARRSAVTGREMDEIAAAADRVWSSRQGELPTDVETVTEPRDLTGARRAKLPASLDAELATLVDAAPEGDEWVHELKLDGYRLLCRRDGKTVRLFTRNGNDWTDRFPTLAEALRALPVKSVVLDGEAVVLDAEGRSSFQALQRAFGERAPALHLFVFDLLFLDGYDVRAAPLLERKALLRRLLAAVPDDAALRLSDHVVGQGPAVLAEACKRGAEGIVSKRADAPYRAGRTRDWLKVKCARRQEFVIAGFTDPSGSRRGFGALVLAARDAGGTLRHVGKVGTGFDSATLVGLRKRLEKLERPKPAITGAPRGRGLHWVEPRLVAEVSFTEWTGDGRIRHPAFVALREDKAADEVRIEMSEPAVPALRTEVAGVRLTHPERVYYPELGITKSELATYYETMADRVLPGLVERPLSLVRCPEGRTGECFYQKRAGRGVPERVARVVVKEGRAPYAMVTDLASLISLVQFGVLEFHPWGARADRLDRPDIIVFDLDPDTAVEWRAVADAAKLLRGLLDELGLASFVRSTGGKGLHVVVPLVRRASWDDVRGFAEGLAGQIVRAAPDAFTANMAKARRPGKIFLDVFRNAPEATAVASWSTRAREGAPVAATLAWDELDGERPLVNVRDAAARLSTPDPWKDFEDARRPLTTAMRRRVSPA